MTNFARNSIAAQTARPGGVAGVRPCDLSMFDADRPGRSGSLAGESFAATLEGHPAYPNLRSGRHRALFGQLDKIVANHLNSLAGILQGLGFDEAGKRIYRSSALKSFRAVLPIK